jgi:nucleoside-diphosphate-sugar epimerase
MKVFITGGTGLIGSHLGAALLRARRNVVFVVRPDKAGSARDRLKDVFISSFAKEDIQNLKALAEIYEGDITDRDFGLPRKVINALKGQVDDLWHCAALSSFDPARKESIKKVNVTGTENALELAGQLNVQRFCHISSAYVCGSSKGKFYERIYERSAVAPFKNVYEESKWLAEQLVHQWGHDSERITQIYRPSVIVGDSNTGISNRFVGYYTLARLIFDLRETLNENLVKAKPRYRDAGITRNDTHVYAPIRIPCAANATVNLITIDHAIHKMLRIAGRQPPSGMIFHIVNRQPPFARDLFEHGLETIGLKIAGFVEHENAIRVNPQKNSVLLQLEEELLRKIGAYLRYLTGEPIFDTKNLDTYANFESEPGQTFNTALLVRLLDYAQKLNWGKTCDSFGTGLRRKI